MVGSAFIYSDGVDMAASECVVARIPSGVKEKGDLMNILYDELRLPGYFGFNWDALSECLRDLEWISCRDVVIFHEDVPLENISMRKIYYEVLDSAVRSWHHNDTHTLKVIFPVSSKVEIERDFSVPTSSTIRRG